MNQSYEPGTLWFGPFWAKKSARALGTIGMPHPRAFAYHHNCSLGGQKVSTKIAILPDFGVSSTRRTRIHHKLRSLPRIGANPGNLGNEP